MSTTNKYICIHGHFYQPPRENAWLEVVEMQDSAAPFHDWNARVNFECYAPNTAARILDSEQNIIKIINNYTRISFNFGPTLLSWLEQGDPETYQAIIDADRQSMERFGGHGSAMAQVHSHLIMPLASLLDKQTQVVWGIKDFEYRFKRKPEGMWLAETAVDLETLEVLAANDIKFTVLAPRQAKAIRKPGEKEWRDTLGAIDTRQPYWCKLPSGKKIALFFYHGGLAQAVAFEGLLNNGRDFANRLISAFDDSGEAQLVHIATDGESYGHHHRYGEMALADCLSHLDATPMVSLTNYGQYLELFPPAFEVQIHEDSSWSCVHGVERWRSNCGCNSGSHSNWTQAWRAPLRQTLNWLRDELLPIYEQEASKLLKDVWKARNEYIEVLLDRSEEVLHAFMAKHARKTLNPNDVTQMVRLLEMQRHALLMFTSCGWFFDEISGIETNQILQYANRAIYYANQIADIDLHSEFLTRLESAPSNVYLNGAVSYRKNVMPARVDLVRVGMHYAASSLFEEYPEHLEFLNYIADSEVFDRLEAGTQRLALGRTTVKSKITLSEKHFSFAVLYLGQHNIIGNISLNMDRERFDEMCRQLSEAFATPDLGQVIGLMQEHFGPEKYSIQHLFQDEKRKILRMITNKSLEQVENAFRDIYNDNYQLMTGITESNIPVPEAYRDAVHFIVNHDLHQFFQNGNFLIRELRRLTNELQKWEIQLSNQPSLLLSAGERIFREIKAIESGNISLAQLNNLITILEILKQVGLNIDLWKSQNLYFSLLKSFKTGDRSYPNSDWSSAFLKLGEMLRVKG